MQVDTPRPAERMAKGQISPIGLAALAIGIMSPALGLYTLWGPMQTATGPVTPWIFGLSALMAMPTALSYVELNRAAPSAGAACSWLWRVGSPPGGFLVGLAMATYFLCGTLAQPITFGLFFQDLLLYLGYSAAAPWVWPVALVLITVPVIFVTWRGAEASTRMSVVLMAIESVAVLALSATILWVKRDVPDGINLRPFDLGNMTHGVPGFWSAMLLGMLAYSGFDVVSTAAEEAKAPASHIPRVILLTIAGIACFWMLNSWVLTLSVAPERVAQLSQQGLTAVTPVAQTYWGQGRIVIILTAFTGIFAIYITSSLGVSRILFALARHGLLPAGLAVLGGRNRVPRRALSLVFIVSLAAAGISLRLLPNGLDAFTWWSNAQVFFMTLTFGAVNLCNLLFFRHAPLNRRRLLANVLVPVVGLLLNIYVCYAAFFDALWNGDPLRQRSVVSASVGLLALYVVAVVIMRIVAPQRLQGPPPLQAEP